MTKRYTILGEYYIELLKEALPKTTETVWFIPAFSYWQWQIYEGITETVLTVLDEFWSNIYEFFMAAKDFDWLIYYEHHHNIYFLGDWIADRAKNRKERRRWKNKILNFSFHPKDTKDPNK